MWTPRFGTGKNSIFVVFILIAFTNSQIGQAQTNVYGGPLEVCSTDPMTGYFRNGYCETEEGDYGSHTVCAEVSKEWLEHQKSMGNDLMTSRYGFQGLKPGDHWCLCASRWKQGLAYGNPTKVKMNATNFQIDCTCIDKGS